MINNKTFATVKGLTVGGEDHFLPELLEAINQAAQIDLSVSFIKHSGLSLIHSALEDALSRGAKIRIITSDYLGITEPLALKSLLLLKEQNASAKLFETNNRTSFHMKVYIFIHSVNVPQESFAFIGSSNLSNSALTSGLEWNVRISNSENQYRFTKVQNEFNALFLNEQASELTELTIARYVSRRQSQQITFIANEIAETLPTTEHTDAYQDYLAPKPNSIQQQALTAIRKSREVGYQRGLVVMATGTGKTWLSAFDVSIMKAASVLFIAHREEILTQARQTFSLLFPDMTTGVYSGSRKDEGKDILFASIQTIGKQTQLHKFSKSQFDYIIVDEFHHAAAPSYQRLLNYFEPIFLLGLTATPQRSDSADILALCDNNLIFEFNLLESIQQKSLVPFHYYGIEDNIDYREIPWRNGKFDPAQLEHKFVTSKRAKHNYESWLLYKQKRTLAFCISIKHADYMAHYFTEKGIKALSVHSQSQTPRNVALHLLAKNDIDVLFCVDLFNEGTDLPLIDTILMLRPTESKIVYLQQIGRGLRTAEQKPHLNIIDFIGNHLSYFSKFESLTGVSSASESKLNAINTGFSSVLPHGCFIHLTPIALDILTQLIDISKGKHVSLYDHLKAANGYRPSVSEYYLAGGQLDKIRHHSPHWFVFVEQQKDLNDLQSQVSRDHGPFLQEIETTRMTKSFKMILLKAFIELDGFINAPTLTELSKRSWSVLRRHPDLHNDLNQTFQKMMLSNKYDNEKWSQYWRKNPIRAWLGENKSSTHSALFSLHDETFMFKSHMLVDAEPACLSEMVLEILDFRLLTYKERGGKD